MLSAHRHCTVWLVRHNRLMVRRIIKGIPKSSSCHDRLIKEAHIMKNLNHPNIPAVYDLEEDDTYSYIVEQYIEGESLRDLCSHRLLSEEEFFRLLIQISSVLEYLHKRKDRVLYLDIKPDNIIISKEEQGKAYLVDFGSAMHSGDGSGPVFATEGWCAPEQEKGHEVSAVTDIYSFGRLIGFLAGHSNLSRRCRRKALGLAAKCTRTKTVERPCSVETVRRTLEEISGKGKQSTKKGRENRRVFTVGVLGLKPGCGATHIAVSAAEYLAGRTRSRVGLIDASLTRDISLADRAEMQSELLCEELLSGGGPGSPDGGCEYKVIDLGCYRDGLSPVAGRCDLNIAVGRPAGWNLTEPALLKRIKAQKGSLENWVVLVNPGGTEELSGYEEAGVPVYFYPYDPDPFNPGAAVKKLFGKMIN